jgi:hypothetical protein
MLSILSLLRSNTAVGESVKQVARAGALRHTAVLDDITEKALRRACMYMYSWMAPSAA